MTTILKKFYSRKIWVDLYFPLYWRVLSLGHACVIAWWRYGTLFYVWMFGGKLSQIVTAGWKPGLSDSDTLSPLIQKQAEYSYNSGGGGGDSYYQCTGVPAFCKRTGHYSWQCTSVPVFMPAHIVALFFKCTMYQVAFVPYQVDF